MSFFHRSPRIYFVKVHVNQGMVLYFTLSEAQQLRNGVMKIIKDQNFCYLQIPMFLQSSIKFIYIYFSSRIFHQEFFC